MPYTLTPDTGIDPNTDKVDYLKDHVDTGDRWVLNFGPQHPATHTTLRLVLELGWCLAVIMRSIQLQSQMHKQRLSPYPAPVYFPPPLPTIFHDSQKLMV